MPLKFNYFSASYQNNFSGLKLICNLIVPLTIYVVLSFYEAKLHASLTADQTPIKSILDLASSNLDLVADENSQTIVNWKGDVFHDDVSGVKTSISYLRTKNWINKPLELGKNYVMSKTGATVSYPDQFMLKAKKAWGMTDDDLCFSGIQMLKLSRAYAAGMMLKKGSPYTEIFNRKLMSIRESGLLGRFSNRYDAQISYPRCLQKDVVKYRARLNIPKTVQLSLADLFAAWVIFLGGFCISFGILVGERIIIVSSVEMIIVHGYLE
jgi:hypothetical protein